jgi:MYXO-CTERM domain-containing protein
MRHRISKLAKVAVVGSALLIGPLVGIASAQAVDPNRPTATTDDDDGTDWGWIGILGLAGLAGLMGRERRATYPAQQHSTTASRV